VVGNEKIMTLLTLETGQTVENYAVRNILKESSRRTTDNNPKWPKQWVMTENKSSSSKPNNMFVPENNIYRIKFTINGL
jgi:hypothetical protein